MRHLVDGHRLKNIEGRLVLLYSFVARVQLIFGRSNSMASNWTKTSRKLFFDSSKHHVNVTRPVSDSGSNNTYQKQVVA
jgi:hypothetical protein